ncbi:sacsin N-terminal ATP-binding-like domain-containing protein [Halobellus ordinarius]|uniref:sacsin N-terminal ATP-binding-like domain-containing protein n=1 Tax=Halobellus ordinarius TaxID=3075120 RepID=UPI002880260B|nr:hypothetical protein [Halobellus sp. ZY16]
MSIIRSTRYRTWLTQRVNSRLEGLAEAAKGDQSLRDAYDAELTSHGNSEEKIARSHEGRELIELIQNARDAIQPSGPGQVYVGILDEGILVANTGKPFDLLDEDTERAVKMIGESNKTDLEDDDTAGVDMDSDSVGHIGVGLKSTVAVGDDFEVWSRRPGDSETLRVRYSRAYITAAVAARFGHQLPTELNLSDGLIGPYAKAAANGLFNPDQQFVNDPIPLKDDLGKAPLFWFPWPLDPSSPGPSNSTLADRANKLLTAPQETLSQFAEPPSDPFRTAVFIEYRDDMWRTLLSAFDIPTPIESPDDPAARADELWEKLSYYGDRAEGFDPETLINLGKIDDLYLERIPQESANETEHWDVTETTPQRTIPDDGVKHRKFDVKISTDSGNQTVTYDSYAGEWDGTGTTRPRLVIERPRTDADGIARASYPLHLYYPISATDDALPVCFHGRFRVTTERKDLSRSSADHNKRVLKHGAELFGRVAGGTAMLACDPETADHWNRYPWLLLPDTESDMEYVPESPKDTADLISYFRRQILEHLRDTAAVPTVNGPTTVDSITLYPSKPVFKSFAAAAEIADTSGTAAITAGTDPVPTLETLRAALTLQSKRGDSERRRQRWKAFVGAERATATLKDWAQWLDSNLTVNESSPSSTGAPTKVVHHRRGKDLFGGMVELVDKAATELDTSIANVLKKDWLADTLPGVYLLPCERADSDETVELVPIEPSPSGQIERGTQSTRTVLWGLDRESLPFSYPPEHGQFDVFFFDQESQRGATEVLSDAGKTRTWGVREYNDLPNLFEALLQTFKPPTRDLDLGSVAALATLVSNLEVDSTTLGQTELAVGSRSHFVNALSKTDRRSLLRLRLGVRRSAIRGPTFPDTKLSDFSLSDSWQQLRHKALQAATTDSGAGGDSNTLEEPEWQSTGDFDASSLPDLTQDADAWTGFPEDLTETDTRRGLARAISLLGVSSLPGIRYLPFHGETHPPVNEGIPHWHPSEWIDEGLPTWAVNHRESLRLAVETTNYTQYITSYNHHPRATINHLGCEKAPTTADSSHQQSYLIGWTWFDPAQLSTLESNPERTRALLERYSNEYRQNLLTTKWHCRRYNGCSMRDATVPTVANLQLRQLPIWDSIVKVTDSLEEQQAWESEQSQLSYAVIQTEGGGRSGWRLFPHIDPDGEDVLLNESLLAEFGVVPLGEIDVTGAEHRLQQVQAVLADVSTDEFDEIDEPVPLSIPSSQVENWKRAYSQLLRPILDAWDTPDDANAVDAKLDELLSTLTHIPLKREGEWYTASIEWVRDHGGSAVWRYPRENPTRWVKTALSIAYEGQPGYRFEHPVQQAGFAEFADKALDIPSISATEPQLSAEEFNARKRPTTGFIGRSKLQRWTDTLQSRLPLLLATISARSHNRLESATETLRTGIDNIAVIERLPADIRADLSDPKSVTYLLPDRVESNGEQARGIAVVASEVDSPTIGDLTQAIALLTKQFGHLGTIQHVLEADEYTQARRRLEGTFPVEDAEQFLEERRRTNLRNRLELAADLLDWLGHERPPVEGAAKQLQERSNEETDLFERLGNDVRSSGEVSGLPDELQTYLNRCRSVDRPIREIIALLFNPGSEGVSTIREHITVLSYGDRKQALIEWFAVHSRELPGDFVPSEIASQCRRLSQIDAVWVETDSEFVQSPVDWHNAVEEKETTLAWHEELPEYASAEDFGTYWLDLCKDDRATALADRLHSQLTNELPDHTAAAVRAYIIDGEPLPSPTESSPDHKERAFASATNYLRENEISSLEIIDDESVSASVAPDSSDSTTATGGTGGQPQSFTGRGELAEVAVTLEILTRTAAWLEADAEHEDILIDQFKDLYLTQTKDGDDAIDYKWHTEGRWNRDLLPLLNQDSEQLLNEFINWQSTIPTSGSLADLASVSLLDVSGEQGPGFDIIDPVTRDGTSFSPRPVEIKSVATTNPPFNIRLSTNEYQQCKLHVSQSDHPYILRIVYVPSDDPTIAASKDVATYQITSVDELRTLVGEPFDMQVRSGYLRPTLDEK